MKKPISIKTQTEQMLRLILTGNEIGPNIYKLMEAMGKQRVLERMDHFEKILRARG